ncbi:MAG TPA: hypothetical protein VGA37_15025 [Gemmatimonadales bacterium]
MTALSAAIMALGAIVAAISLVVALRRWDEVGRRLGRVLDSLDRDARPALEAARRTADEASRVATMVRDEVAAVAGTSRKVRRRIERTARSFEERFIELETLLDVVQGEVEDTALDVAAALRTTRRGSGILRTMKRAFLRRRT